MYEFAWVSFHDVELAESVRVTDKAMPIIFMTAKDDKSSKMLGYNVGIDEYVTKPFDMDVLLMTIKAILRRKYAII